MIKVWSETPGARVREQLADVATLAWLVFWGNIAWQLFQLLAGFAQAGRTIHSGGQSMIQGGRDLGESLSGIPLVGEGARNIVRDAFSGAGAPLSRFGTDLERFILIVATILTLLFVLATIGPWLARYLPWRWERLQRVRAAHRVIRTAPKVSHLQIEHALAMRAFSRLDYATLLEYSPDPLGDWARGRHDRLARAELASVGLRP